MSNAPTPNTQTTYSEDHAVSQDGTKIGYRQLGTGPGLLIVHGSMSSGYNHLELAEALSDSFTVYLIDRRGRGLSGPYREDHSATTDVEDITAIIAKTGAHDVFAVSFGALVCLQAARTLATIHKLAVYEPLIFNDSSTPAAMVAQVDKAIADKNMAAALGIAMKGAQLGSSFMNGLPLPVLTFMTKGMMNWTPPGEYTSFKDLAPTLSYEGKVIAELSGKQETFKDIPAKVLLLGGSKSSDFLKGAVKSVANVLPTAERIELPGLNHNSPWNKKVRGNPKPIAQELKRFFAGERTFSWVE
jgi:pimeloyl-ACP methyl ester carboxylesterase